MIEQVVLGLVKFTVSTAVGVIVKNAVRSTTPVAITALNKVLIGIGEVVIGGALSQNASDYTVDQLRKFGIFKQPEKKG